MTDLPQPPADGPVPGRTPDYAPGYAPGPAADYPPGPAPGDPAPYAATEAPAPERRSRRGLLIGAGAAVLAVVAGAAVYATTTLSGGGRQPDELVPKSTFAYVKVDLDPAAGQKLAARSFFGKFPSLKDDAGDPDDVFENVLAEVVRSGDLDFARDVRPWFDKRGAVAAFPLAGGRPGVVGVLRSKDDTRARTALDGVVQRAQAKGEQVSYRLTRGYAVVGETPAVTEALRLAEDESLRDNEVYRDDVDSLDGDQVAVVWANLGEAFDRVKGALPGAALLPPVLNSQVRGRVVAGLHFTGDYAEVQGRTIGFDTRTVPPASGGTTLLQGLPADTTAAIALSGLARSATEAGGLLDLDALADRYLQGSGLSFSNDIAPILGDEAVVAAGPFTGLTSLRLGYVARVEDPARAARAGTKVAALLSFFGIEVDARAGDGRIVLATPPDYAEQLASGQGTLGSSPAFTKAMGDLAGASFAVYLDANAAREALPAFFGPGAGSTGDGLASLGLVTGVRGDHAFFRARVVAG